MINGRKIVALCTCRIYEPQEFVFISEFSRMLRENGYYLFIYALNSEMGNSGEVVPETAVFDLIPYEKIDSIVIMDEKIKSREIVGRIVDRAHNANVPVVVIDGKYDNASQVVFDYASGFEDVVRHMIEYHKVRRPHLMAGKKGNVFSDERIEVFKRVIEENGISFEDDMLSYGDFWAIPARAAATELLKREKLPDAIICANDIMAINVCDIFQGSGVKVPGDVLVSGFDGIEEGFWSKPAITTATCDSFMLASAAMETVDRAVAGEKDVVKSVRPSFVANESCGCPKCSQVTFSATKGLNNNFYHHQDDIHDMQLITSKIMLGKDLINCVHYLKDNLARHACVVVKDACFEQENNLFFEEPATDTMTVYYDSYADNDKPFPYDPQIIVPHLEEIMERGEPLIFNALEYMEKCPGFVAYFFPKVELIEFNQTPNLANCFGMGIGGYAINKYQKYLHEKIERMYKYDALTGLNNRMAFISKYEELLKDPSNYGKKVTIFVADLNGLKKINDSFGHLAGDKAIATVAMALKKACPSDAICVRIGGDEMLAFILGDHQCDNVIPDVEAILEKESLSLEIRVSASIGTYTAVFEKDMDINKLIAIADAQMYEMKRNRK